MKYEIVICWVIRSIVWGLSHHDKKDLQLFDVWVIGFYGGSIFYKISELFS